MKKTFLTAILLAITLPILAGEPGKTRHQVRIGWGDMLFETLVFTASPTHQFVNPSELSPDYTYSEKDHFGYTGHFFAGYQYRLNKVMAVGAQVDFEGIFWQETSYDRFHTPLAATTHSRNYNLTVLPEMRFYCFSGRWINIYAGVGAGTLFAFDTAGNTALTPALNLNPLGIQVGYDHWWGGVELGFMAALSGGNQIYMLGSRLVSVSLNYRW